MRRNKVDKINKAHAYNHKARKIGNFSGLVQMLYKVFMLQDSTQR